MSSVIRPARPEDVPAIVQMGLRFLADVYAGKIAHPDPDRMARTAGWLIDDDPTRALLVSEADGAVTGMIGVFVFDHAMTGERMASELMWWVEPSHRGHGLRLLTAARLWAKAAGATTIQMIAPTPEVEVLYTRLGYMKIESAYAGAL